MKPAPGLFVRIAGDVRGPYGVDQLRQLAEVEVIAPATEAAFSAAGPWARLETMVEVAVVFPPRAKLDFKPTEFAVENRDSAPEVNLRDLIASANGPSPPAVAAGMGSRIAAADAAQKSVPPNEVAEIVRDVGRREAQFAPPLPPPKPWRPSRRLKFCVVLAIAGNATLAAILTIYGAWHDEMSMTMLAAWAVLYNGGVTMVYFGMPRE